MKLTLVRNDARRRKLERFWWVIKARAKRHAAKAIFCAGVGGATAAIWHLVTTAGPLFGQESLSRDGTKVGLFFSGCAMVFVVCRYWYLWSERNKQRKENWLLHHGKAPYDAVSDGTHLYLIRGEVRLLSSIASGAGRLVSIRRAHDSYIATAQDDEPGLVAFDKSITAAFTTGKLWRAAPWAVRTAGLRLRLVNLWAAMTEPVDAVVLVLTRLLRMRYDADAKWGWQRWVLECAVIFIGIAATSALVLLAAYNMWHFRTDVLHAGVWLLQ